jgi:hypothetical protein
MQGVGVPDSDILHSAVWVSGTRTIPTSTSWWSTGAAYLSKATRDEILAESYLPTCACLKVTLPYPYSFSSKSCLERKSQYANHHPQPASSPPPQQQYLYLTLKETNCLVQVVADIHRLDPSSHFSPSLPFVFHPAISCASPPSQIHFSFGAPPLTLCVHHHHHLPTYFSTILPKSSRLVSSNHFIPYNHDHGRSRSFTTC